MGITIYYSGSLKSENLLPDLIEEAKEVAEAHAWPFKIYGETLPKGAFRQADYDGEIYGIQFIPPESEPVYLTFLSNGRMSNALNLRVYGKDSQSPKPEFLHQLFTKTQFAGPDIHKFLVKFFKYLQPKYFSEFEFEDDSGFWTTGDEEDLEFQFNRMNRAINSFASAFDSIPMEGKDTLETYIERIWDQVKGESGLLAGKEGQQEGNSPGAESEEEE